jgi:hypothetical protein
MATRIVKLPAVNAVRKQQPTATNTYAICDSIGDYATLTNGHCRQRSGDSWLGGMGGEQSTKCLREGDMAGAALADDYLTKVESLVAFETHTWRVIHDVTGGVPNVPAYLAGHPLNMRRRQRQVNEQGPLAVVVDLTSSAGVNASDVRKRGCAILALVRALTGLRPVELWAVVGLGEHGSACEILTRIDTTPLDLARAAHMLTHPSVSRGLGYGYLHHVHASGGGWNFGDIDLQRQTARESLMRVMHPSADVLYIAPIFVKDRAISDPVAWLKDMLAKHGGVIED